jgi:hypothetical protein
MITLFKDSLITRLSPAIGGADWWKCGGVLRLMTGWPLAGPPSLTAGNNVLLPIFHRWLKAPRSVAFNAPSARDSTHFAEQATLV